MRYIFPFNAHATNPIMLTALTMSYICYPILALIVVHVACTYIPAINSEQRMYYASAAFLFVGIYSIVGLITMHFSFFRKKHKNK